MLYRSGPFQADLETLHQATFSKLSLADGTLTEDSADSSLAKTLPARQQPIAFILVLLQLAVPRGPIHHMVLVVAKQT
jgi:hypothetical protein